MKKLIFLLLLVPIQLFSQTKAGVSEKIFIQTDHPYSPAYTNEFPIWQDFIYYPDASFIKVHFSKFDLGPNDYVVIRSEDSKQYYRYEGKGRGNAGEFYAIHIKGDLAIIELYAPGEKGGFGFIIDSYGRGYTKEEYYASPEAICGSIDWKNAKCYSGEIYRSSKPVARLLVPDSNKPDQYFAYCTGWLIGCEGHLITNNHCISSQAETNNTDFEFMAEGENCETNCDYNMACPGTILTGDATFIKGSPSTKEGLDYSLIKLPNNPHLNYGYLQLRNVPPKLNEKIYIVQHPNGFGKKIALESTYSGDDGFCKINDDNYNHCYEFDVGYYCDTEHGSSGSPVLSKESNLVIALHHCGTCMNSAVPITDIIEHLENDLPKCALPCSPPAAPSGLIVAKNCNFITLAWNAVSSADGYNIYRYTGTCTGASWTKIGTTASTTYTDINVSVGATYAYVVRAYKDYDTCESNNSNCVSTTVKSYPEIPQAPTVNDGCSMLIINWNASQGAQYYNVLRRAGGCGNDNWEKIASGITETNYIDYNIPPGATFGYRIQAANEYGTVGNIQNCASGTHSAPDISGRVKEIKHQSGQTVTEYIGGVKIEDLTEQLGYTFSSSSANEYERGKYYFNDVQGSTYHLKACRTDWLDGEEYQVCYNPLPYRTVTVCKNDVPNQDFWLDVFVIHIDGLIPLPIMGPPIDLSNLTVSAYSTGYFTSTKTNSEGYYRLLLPSGIYKIVSRKDCYVTYPPYITQTVTEQPISNINFQITDWQVCDNCYATLYREQKDCGLLINPEECLNNSILKFKQCVFTKTQDANSSLFNAIILSVEVQRAKGKPEWQSYNFEVFQEGDFFVNLTNGDYFNQETACSSAEVNIEGIGQIFGPNDFNKNVFALKKQLHLLPGTYTLNAIVWSQPGCYITIVISNKDVISFPELP